MLDTPLAAIGVVVQWSCSAMLALFFLRLSRSVVRRGFTLWAFAWATQLLLNTGTAIHAVGFLSGNPASGSTLIPALAFVAVPSMLVFAVLAITAAFQFTCPPVSRSVFRSSLVAAAAAGVAVAAIGTPALTGAVVIGWTVAAFIGASIVLFRSERHAGRFPAIAIMMFLFGAVISFFEVGSWFGRTLWPVDDFAGIAGWSSGYAIAAASLVLAATLIVRLVDERAAVSVASDDIEVDDAALPDSSRFTRQVAAPVIAEVLIPDWEGEPELQTEPVIEAAVVAPPAPDPVITELPAARARTATLPRPPLRANGEPAEVLLIDDEAAVRSTLARIFQRGGWAVRDASTGEEALAWLLDVPLEAAPAVILCDFRMPGMDGQGLFGHLERERPELLSRVVFVTGDASGDSARAFIASTSLPIVEKPFTVTEIARAVERILSAPAAPAA